MKLVFEELADAAARRRFQRETQTASSLNHPHNRFFHVQPLKTNRSSFRFSGAGRRTNFGHISLRLTIDDAKAYTRPWTVNLSGFNFLADEELRESICENEKDVAHMVGK